MAEDKYSKARKARGLRKTILSPDDEPDTLKRAREEVRNTRGIETIKTGGKIMASGCGMKKKYEEGGKVEKSKGVKGRTSYKAKEDQKQFQIGYARGLKDAENNFDLKGDASKDTIENKLEKGLRKVVTSKKNYEGYGKGKKDMDAALKGQGAYKKGGAVKHRGDGCCMKGKTKGRMV